MADQLLVNVVTVTLPPLGTVVVPHGLKSGGVGIAPTQIICDRASPIGAPIANATNVTFVNLSASVQTAQFRIEHDHTIHAFQAIPTYWQGYAAPVGSEQAIFATFSDSTDQPLAAGVPEIVKFNTNEGSNGVSVVNDPVTGFPTRLTVAYAGVYLVNISPQLVNSGGGGATITFWLKLNGVNVPRSASSLEMGNNNNRTIPFFETSLALNAGQYLEWAFLSTGANTSLEHFAAAGAVPEIPSVVSNIHRVGDLP